MAAGVGDGRDGLWHAIAIEVTLQFHSDTADPFASIGDPVIVAVQEDRVANLAEAAVAEVLGRVGRQGGGQRHAGRAVAAGVRVHTVHRQACRQRAGGHRHGVAHPRRRRAQPGELVVPIRTRRRADRFIGTVPVQIPGQGHGRAHDAFTRIKRTVVIDVGKNPVADLAAAAIAKVLRQITRRPGGQRHAGRAVAAGVRIHMVDGQACREVRIRRVHRDRVAHAGRGGAQAGEEINAIGAGRGRHGFIHAVPIRVAHQCNRDVRDAFARVIRAVVVHVRKHRVADAPGPAIAEVLGRVGRQGGGEGDAGGGIVDTVGINRLGQARCHT